MSMDDKWVKAALLDDAHVVHLLLQLKDSLPQPVFVPPLVWGLRQHRTKQTAVKGRERRSPTTPLSWSADSVSDDGNAESNRSVGTMAYDTNVASTSKTSSKRKTFSQLKEEETCLLNERVHLEKELASLNVTLNEQIYRRGDLKKLKQLDCQVQAPGKIVTISGDPESTVFNQLYVAETSTTIGQSHLVHLRRPVNNDQPSHDSLKVHKVFDAQGKGFVLPDLNVMPFEEEEPCDIFGIRL